MLIETIQHGFIVVDSPRGNDSTARRDSWSNPFATLSQALQVVRDNDVVLIYPGPYLERPLEPTDIAIQTGGGAPLHLQNRRGVTLRGIGRPEVWFTHHGNGLTLENCSDVCVEGLDFRGAGILTEPKPYYFALLLLHGVNEAIRVRNCGFLDSGNHGIAHLLEPRTTNNSVFEKNRFVNGGHMNHPWLGRDGAAIALGGSGNTFYSNRIERWLRGVELESGNFPGRDQPTSRNIVASNTFLQCWWQHICVLPTHFKAALFDQIIIESNIIQGWGTEPPRDGESRPFPHEGIYFAGGVNAHIRGNSISDMWDGIGIRLSADWSDIQDLLVSENRVWNVDRTGIHAVSSDAENPVAPARDPLPEPSLVLQRVDGIANLSITASPGQTVRVQRRRGEEDGWTDWQIFTMGDVPVELTDAGWAAPGEGLYRVLAGAPAFRLKRCRFVNNKIGPCRGRGIWIRGDHNVVESNDIHECGDTALWQGLFVEEGQCNILRQNRLIDCLPLEDRGRDTQALNNDHFWDKKTAPL